MVGMHFGMLSERWMDELFNISLMRLRCVYSCTKAFDDERRLEISGLLGAQQYLLLCGAGVRTAGCVLSSLDRISRS